MIRPPNKSKVRSTTPLQVQTTCRLIVASRTLARARTRRGHAVTEFHGVTEKEAHKKAKVTALIGIAGTTWKKGHTKSNLSSHVCCVAGAVIDTASAEFITTAFKARRVQSHRAIIEFNEASCVEVRCSAFDSGPSGFGVVVLSGFGVWEPSSTVMFNFRMFPKMSIVMFLFYLVFYATPFCFCHHTKSFRLSVYLTPYLTSCSAFRFLKSSISQVLLFSQRHFRYHTRRRSR